MMSAVCYAELEEATFIRQRGVIELTAKLLEVSSVGNLGGGLLRLVLLTYKVLTAAAKLHIVGKGEQFSMPSICCLSEQC